MIQCQIVLHTVYDDDWDMQNLNVRQCGSYPGMVEMSKWSKVESRESSRDFLC